MKWFYGKTISIGMSPIRDGNGYWTRPGSVDPYPFSRIWVLKNWTRRIRIRLNFTGPDPDLRKIPRPGPADLEDPFFFIFKIIFFILSKVTLALF